MLAVSPELHKISLYHCDFDLHFLVTVMLSSSPCVYWSFVYILWRNVVHILCPFKKIRVIYLFVLRILYIFLIQGLTETWFANIFSLSVVVFLNFLDNIIWNTKVLNFDAIQYFCFCCLFSWYHVENPCLFVGHAGFHLFPSKNFIVFTLLLHLKSLSSFLYMVWNKGPT